MGWVVIVVRAILTTSRLIRGWIWRMVDRGMGEGG